MILSVSLPDGLVDEADAAIQRHGYRGRSELVRVALIDFLRRDREEQSKMGLLNTIIVLGYPERAERSVSDIRHEHNDLVKSMLHAHTAGQRCATVLLAEGPADSMRQFLAQLRRVRDMGSVETTILE